MIRLSMLLCALSVGLLACAAEVNRTRVAGGDPLAEPRAGFPALPDNVPNRPDPEPPVQHSLGAPPREFASEVFAFKHGAHVARRDLARGRRALLTFGYPAPCRSAYAQVLAREYRVQLVARAGCVVTDSLLAEIRGYNQVVEARIRAEFGADALERAASEAGCM